MALGFLPDPYINGKSRFLAYLLLIGELLSLDLFILFKFKYLYAF